MKLRYIFSRQKRESMTLRERSIPNRCHALLSMEKIWSFHLASSVKVRPICLWERTDSIGTLFISKGGWIGLSRFLEKIIDSVFNGLSVTSQEEDHVAIF